MPPSTPSMAMFHRGGNYLHQRLTKLYSDTKQSYESAAVTPTSTNASEDPEVKAVRRDFEIQHDRLLAWGYHWTDTKAVEAQFQSQGDVEIDKQLDQAGYSDVVANVMSEIQRLLEESGKLQHPEKYLLASKLSRSPQSHRPANKEWTMHEVTTSRALLDQLTTCIDVLYSLSESRRTMSQSDKWDHKPSSPLPASVTTELLGGVPATEQQSRKRQRTDDDEGVDELNISQDSLLISLDSLELDPEAAHDSMDPPPYDEVNSTVQERIFGTLIPTQTPVLVNFVSVSRFSGSMETFLSLKRVHLLTDVVDRLSADQVLSHNCHLKLLGFTIDEPRSRIGLVFEMDRKSGPNQSRRLRTLGSIVSAAYSSSTPSSPTLENRFRLAYNILFSVLGYLSKNKCHRYINSDNIIYEVGREKSNALRNWDGIRKPYLLPSVQKVLSTPSSEDSLPAKIYRHPADNSNDEWEVVLSHEIYSLGLILLEVGLWVPLTKLWKPKYDRASFMNKVKTIYVHNLASKCSSKYMHAVQKCLNAPVNLSVTASANTGSMFHDSVEYLLDIAKDLSQCCALDDEGPPPPSDMVHIRTLLAESENPVNPDQEDSSLLQAPMTPQSIIEDESSNARAEPEIPEIVEKARSEQKHALRKWPELDIPQTNLDQWNTTLMPRLSKLLQVALQGSPESCSVSLMMVGNTPDSAKTTICIQCQDTARVQKALRQRFRPKRGWGVVVLKGDVKRSGRRRRKPKSNSHQQQILASSEIEKLREQYYQERPSCGASIGAFKDGEHLPPVSFGGTIMVDSEPFGMTVHHMLDNVSDDEGDEELLQRSSATRAQARLQLNSRSEDLLFPQDDTIPSDLGDLEISDDEESDSDSDASTIRPDYSAFDADGNEFWFLEDAPSSEPGLDDDEGSESQSSGSDDEEDDTASIGDRVGIDPSDDDMLHVTQPAIDDVDEDFFPNVDDRDDDHLSSHAFGYVHASSGIKRVVSGDLKHEVDWALIKIQDERLRIGNAIRSDIARRRGKARQRPHRMRSDSNPILEGITPSGKLGGTEVHCCGRSSGFRSGRISQAMALVKLHGRQSFSSSWCVEGGFGVPGDSGAWIYNPANRQLCGHVLAWGNKSKTAYIAPMEVLFDDIKASLGAESVCLPGHADAPPPSASSSTALSTREGDEVNEATLNEQIQNSRDIEVALRGMALDTPSSMTSDMRPLPPLPKDACRASTRAENRGMAEAVS